MVKSHDFTECQSRDASDAGASILSKMCFALDCLQIRKQHNSFIFS